MHTAALTAERDLTFVDNEEGFDVLKRAGQARDRAAIAAGQLHQEDIGAWALGDSARRATVRFQDHADAF